jgi:hypothetical protein
MADLYAVCNAISRDELDLTVEELVLRLLRGASIAMPGARPTTWADHEREINTPEDAREAYHQRFDRWPEDGPWPHDRV